MDMLSEVGPGGPASWGTAGAGNDESAALRTAECRRPTAYRRGP
jgi:hypothetical protein